MDNEEEPATETEQRLVDISEAMLAAARAHPAYAGNERIFLSIARDADGEETGIGQFDGYDGTTPNVLFGDIQAFLAGTRERTGLAMMHFLPRPSMN